MRTKEIDILKSLYFPLLAVIGEGNSVLQQSVKDERFWEYFNGILLGVKASNIELLEFFSQYKIEISHKLSHKLEELKKEYISQLIAEHLNGNLDAKYAAIIEANPVFRRELEFQTDLKKAITWMEQARLKKKLSLLEEAAKFEISDNEVAVAFEALDKKNKLEELKKKMTGWDAQSKTKKIPDGIFYQLANDENGDNKYDSTRSLDSTKKSNRKTRSTVTLMLLRLAAAASIGVGATWGGYELYKKFIAEPKQLGQRATSQALDTFENNSFQNTSSKGILLDSCESNIHLSFDYPTVELSTKSLKIEKVEFAGCHTIISYKFGASHDYENGGWVQYNSDAYIFSPKKKKKFLFIKAEGIPLHPNRHHFQNEDDTLLFKVYFQRLDTDITKFDVINCEGANCLNSYGVLISNRGQVTNLQLEDSTITKANDVEISPNQDLIKRPNYKVVISNNKYGVTNLSNDTIISCKYESINIYPYKDTTFFIVEDRGKFGAVDIKGKSFVPIVHPSVKYTKSIVMILLETKKDADFQIGVDPNKTGPR